MSYFPQKHDPADGNPPRNILGFITEGNPGTPDEYAIFPAPPYTRIDFARLVNDASQFLEERYRPGEMQHQAEMEAFRAGRRSAMREAVQALENSARYITAIRDDNAKVVDAVERVENAVVNLRQALVSQEHSDNDDRDVDDAYLLADDPSRPGNGGKETYRPVRDAAINRYAEPYTGEPGNL